MKNTGHIALILTVVLAGYLILDKLTDSEGKKVGVVQMEKLVYDFNGMKEATKEFSSKVQRWNNESDSLEKQLRNLLREIKIDSVRRDEAKLRADLQSFRVVQNTFMELSQDLQVKAQQEDEQMTLGVLNQLNEYIKSFAEREGYDVILCNSQNKSVGYAKEQIDITTEVLEYSNQKYEGVK